MSDQSNDEDAVPEEDSGTDQETRDEDSPRITLDRYLSRRRSPQSGIPHLVTAVVMLVILVLVILYKDRCGDIISGVMGELDPPAEQASPPVRFEVKPGGK